MAGLGGDDERRLRELKEEVAMRALDLEEARQEVAKKSGKLEEARQSVIWWTSELKHAREEVATRTYEFQDATKELETLTLDQPRSPTPPPPPPSPDVLILNICQDLVVLILKRLPVNALLRFRCVSKSWKQLIDSKSFILGHLTVQSQRPRLIAQHNSSNYLRILDPRTLPYSDNLTLTFTNEKVFRNISSLHGVFCIYDDAQLLIWNPSIRRVLKIPYLDCSGFQGCSFWIDPSNNEFKIVILSTYRDTANVDLFLSRNKAWTEAGTGDINYFRLDWKFYQVQVHIDGVAHWTASYVKSDRLGKRSAILFFDFGEQKFGTIELPEQVRREPPCDSKSAINICKWRDFLSVVEWWYVSPYACNLWVMQNGSWSMMFRFNLNRGFSKVFCVLESWGRGLASTNGGHDLMLYDSNGSRSIPVKPKFESQGTISIAYDFVESLVFPD